jgi:hypothetical protein
MAKMTYDNKVINTQAIVSQLSTNPEIDFYVGPKGYIGVDGRASNVRISRNGETFNM